LLERRPDVVAAERRIAAAFYGVQEAQAARLPRIALTGNVSDISSDLFVLQDRDNPVWSAGASLMLPVFNAGALQSQVRVRTAEQKQAVAEYGRIGARAFGEVEDALSAEFAAARRERLLGRAVAENEIALELSQVRHDVGSGDLRGVRQQQLAAYGSQAALVRVQAERLVQRVNLYLALGGGFEAAPPTAPVAQAKE
jgi:outer membrane protein TolC